MRLSEWLRYSVFIAPNNRTIVAMMTSSTIIPVTPLIAGQFRTVSSRPMVRLFGRPQASSLLIGQPWRVSGLLMSSASECKILISFAKLPIDCNGNDDSLNRNRGVFAVFDLQRLSQQAGQQPDIPRCPRPDGAPRPSARRIRQTKETWGNNFVMSPSRKREDKVMRGAGIVRTEITIGCLSNIRVFIKYDVHQLGQTSASHLTRAQVQPETSTEELPTETD